MNFRLLFIMLMCSVLFVVGWCGGVVFFGISWLRLLVEVGGCVFWCICEGCSGMYCDVVGVGLLVLWLVGVFSGGCIFSSVVLLVWSSFRQVGKVVVVLLRLLCL